MSQDGIDQGSVKIDLVNNEIMLSLSRTNFCLAGHLCAAVMPVVREYTAQIVKRYSDKCNASYYVAKTDKRPVDGLLTQIKIVDNSRNTCPTMMHIPLVPTVIQLKLQSLRDRTGDTHRFYGNTLN